MKSTINNQRFENGSRTVKKYKIILVCLIVFLTGSYFCQKELMEIYDKQNSVIIQDRNEKIIFIGQNEKGYWAEYIDEIPEEFKNLLIKKEDRYFYYHFGINPVSSFRAGMGYFGLGQKRGSSTITQQLVKILLEKELKRNIKNKIIEAFYSISLEIFHSKETILRMYVNSIYFGNQSQGLSEASRIYFNTSPEILGKEQILQLLATISSPAKTNPSKSINKQITLSLSEKLNEMIEKDYIMESKEIKKNMPKYSHSSQSYFEIKDMVNNSCENIKLTIDQEITEKIREIARRNIEILKHKNVENSAVIVIKLPENELLALIGSPNPKSFESGSQINMLLEPRPIGSTVKPFIYLKAFEKGLRPYTLVVDREYKYITALGFPLYPKNFDYKYRGETNLHYSLSNSLNVPAVKTLEYVGLQNFYDFLEKDLGFEPIQDLNNYQLGIALGTLEMDLLNLCRYFAIFPNNGTLKNLKIISRSKPVLAPNFRKKIAEPEYIQLINKILQDRKTGIKQFGLKSDFNLFQPNYALKTGTSRDFHDSWVIGYTPDFLVGVWMGNADNTGMEGVSSQIGAGAIWAETMELLLNSEYNKKTDFEFNLLTKFYDNGNMEYGLAGDDYEKYLNALKENDSEIILSPHNNDIFLLQDNTEIILEAKEAVRWFVNDEFFGENKKTIFAPKQAETYKIKAETQNGFQQTITIYLTPMFSRTLE